MSNRKHRKDLFSVGLKRNHPNKFQLSKNFYKKQVFINWFLRTQFLLIIRTEW